MASNLSICRSITTLVASYQHYLEDISDYTRMGLLDDNVSNTLSILGYKFDITMGSYPGVEICELVGLFMLGKLKQHNMDSILYREDGAIISNKPPRQRRKLAEKVVHIYKQEGHTLTIKANLHVIDF